MTQSKLHVCCTSFVGSRDPQKVIGIDTQGCLTYIVKIFKFGDVSGPSIKPDTPINVYTRFCLNTAKSKFCLVSPVAD